VSLIVAYGNAARPFGARRLSPATNPSPREVSVRWGLLSGLAKPRVSGMAGSV